MSTYVVIGAGISGLSAAYWLKTSGASTIVLESTDRIGGTMASEQHAGFLFEHGPNSFLNNQTTTWAMVEGCGAHHDVVSASTAAKKRLIHHRAQLTQVPTSPPAFLKSPLLSRNGLLEMLAEPFRVQERPDGEETLAAFLDRRIGSEARQTLVDALVGGIYAGDTTSLSAEATFPSLVEAEHQYGSIVVGMVAKMLQMQRAKHLSRDMCSFRDGMQQFPRYLADFLGKDSIYTHTKSVTLHKSSQNRYVVSAIIDGVHREIDCKGVVIATPAHRAAALLAPLGPTSATDALMAIPYAPVQLVGLGYANRYFAENPPSGFGFLVSRQSSLPILGCLYSSSVFPNRAPENHTMLTVFLGGARDPNTTALSDDELVDRATAAVCETLHINGPGAARFIKRWERGIPQFTLGHRARVNAIRQTQQIHPRLQIVGNYLDGVSMHDCIAGAKAAADRLTAEAP
ncbi:MAG: protoporphyrinogen oxidase [Myxococcales bacterium]|nr:protoporphyrinogen oxidase [Myxococcales bacterium]